MTWRAASDSSTSGTTWRSCEVTSPTSPWTWVYLHGPTLQLEPDVQRPFKEKEARPSTVQIEAFDDTWHWGTPETQAQYEELITSADVPAEVAKAIEANSPSGLMNTT